MAVHFALVFLTVRVVLGPARPSAEGAAASVSRFRSEAAGAVVRFGTAGSSDVRKTWHESRRNSGRHILIRKLWEKADGVCWLCHDYVDFEADEASRDHVIPFAQGGTGEWSNIRLAHKECNELRGNPAYGVVVRDVFLSRTEMIDRKPI